MGNLLGKRKLDDDVDDLETNPILKKQKVTSEETITEELADDPSLQHKSDDDQEADSFGKRILEDDDLKKLKETSEETLITEELADPSLQHKSDDDQEETMEGLNDDTPDLVEEDEAASMKNTLCITHLSRHANIQDIIDFFKGVVHVRLAMKQDGKHAGYGFLEFASDKETKKALEKKNGKSLLNRKITLYVANKKTCPLPKYSLDHKVSYEEDCLGREEDETTPAEDQVLFVANLSPQTKISDIKRFFLNVGVAVVSVRLIVNQEGKHVGYGFVEFLSAYQAKKALEMKNGEYLHDHKISLMMMKGGHGETETTPNFAEEVAIRKTRTLFVAHLTSQTKISHIISFFKDVGQVVHVRLIANNKGKHVGWGFLEFASANEAEKALQTKNGAYFQGGNILLQVAKMNPLSPPKYCIDHKVWYEDYLRQEEDVAVEGLADYVEEEARKKTLFVTNLPSQVKTRHIISFFKDVGQVVGVRLIVDHMGKHVGCGFVEFASADEAEDALEHKNGQTMLRFSQSFFSKMFLDVAERAPYTIRPNYNLVEKLWYEDNLLREPNLKHQEVKSDVIRFWGKKTIFSYDDDNDNC
ncbi:PREDICTED: nucleolin-like [Camelina sativa]|uniref:Nucleolin-like n=1 Tax=Camelina sativa TaxID=90675 RepID=A0ABM0Z1Y5_CAMSA|nr:PREDICTED: nucleolin-like [Camelina sativa]